MDFGELILSKRREQELDIQTFANKIHVNVGTISRIENSHTQPTIYTAFRLTEGLGITLSALLQNLDFKDSDGHYIQLELNKSAHEEHVLTFSDVENLVRDFSSNGSRVRSYLSSTLSRLYKFSETTSSPNRKHSRLATEDTHLSANDEPFFAPNDIDKLLSLSSLYRFEIRYPSAMKPTIISATYDSKGAIINNDIGPLIRGFSLQSSRLSRPSNNFLGRIGLGSGSFDRIKLNEIMSMDKELNLNGKLLGIFWEVCKFDESFNSPIHLARQIDTKDVIQESLFDLEEDDLPLSGRTKRHINHKLATLYVIIYRWYQYMSDIRDLGDFEKYSVS